ncbi:MAG: hypothetical protein QNJ74_12180 [Trichodesmium sp. MO_231.B1]|nr:hypothetical protein [Trichodesmium sp. MO_231.B1]
MLINDLSYFENINSLQKEITGAGVFLFYRIAGDYVFAEQRGSPFPQDHQTKISSAVNEDNCWKVDQTKNQVNDNSCHCSTNIEW